MSNCALRLTAKSSSHLGLNCYNATADTLCCARASTSGFCGRVRRPGSTLTTTPRSGYIVPSFVFGDTQRLVIGSLLAV